MLKTLLCRVTVALIVLVAMPSFASAQAITAYQLKIWNVGAPAPFSTTTLSVANIVCNQTPITSPPTVTNPTRFEFDDVANVGKVCIFTDTGTGPLLSLPFASTPLQATLAAVNSAGTSPDSVASNSFTRPGVAPPVPTGARVAP